MGNMCPSATGPSQMTTWVHICFTGFWDLSFKTQQNTGNTSQLTASVQPSPMIPAVPLAALLDSWVWWVLFTFRFWCISQWLSIYKTHIVLLHVSGFYMYHHWTDYFTFCIHILYSPLIPCENLSELKLGFSDNFHDFPVTHHDAQGSDFHLNLGQEILGFHYSEVSYVGRRPWDLGEAKYLLLKGQPERKVDDGR